MGAESTPDPMVPALYRIIERRQETDDTFTWALSPLEGPVMGFEAGQFNMIYAFGVGEVPISVSGDPTGSGPLIHTIRDVGGVTATMARYEVGQVVGVRGPYGTPWPVAQAEGQDVVLVAGGLGLAPLRPALYQVLANRTRYGRVVLLVGARRPEDLAFEAQLHEWRGRFDLEVEVSVDNASRGWLGRVGVVTTLIPRASFDGDCTTAFVCGPEIMMRYTARELQRAGVSAEDIHVTMERNMKCAVRLCGRCQFGPHFVCQDGPVFSYARIAGLMSIREV